MKINITVEEGAIAPKRMTKGASGFDLFAFLSREVYLYPGQRVLIKTGVKAEFPQGYEGQVRPRSGLALKKGITCLNTPGTIDSDYRGDIGVILINHSDDVFEINNGDRIAQLVIQEIPEVELLEVNELDTTDRGEGGYGSTGV